MKAFYGSKISENMTKTPEGFLICFNVPIARTGWYEYLADELGVPGKGVVKVYRSPEDVFSKKAMASFEGKPITNNHPPDLLTPQNSGIYLKGAVQNVRRSSNDEDLLIADLIIYDDTLIDQIENQGKREVSCGYELKIVDNGDGTYSQTNIIGNHVAVVDNGRAGHSVSIKDSKIKEMEGEKKKMKNRIPKQQRGPVTNFFAALGLKHFATDAEPEEIAEAIDSLAEEREVGDEELNESKKEEGKEKADDGDPISTLEAKVDKLAEIVTQLVQSDKKVHEEIKPEDALDAMIEELSKDENTTGEEENSVTVPVEEMDEDVEETVKSSDSAAMLTALKAMRPVIATIKDPNERKVACDSLMAQFKNAKKNTTKDNGYKKILNAQKINSASKAQKAADSDEKKYEKINNDYASRNPHKVKKEMK